MSHLSVPTLPTDSPVCKDSSLAWEGHKACRTGLLFVLSMQLFCYCTCRSAPLNHVLRVDLSAIQGVNYNNKDITGRADKSTNPHAHAIAIVETQLTERLHETSMKIKMNQLKVIRWPRLNKYTHWGMHSLYTPTSHSNMLSTCYHLSWNSKKKTGGVVTFIFLPDVFIGLNIVLLLWQSLTWVKHGHGHGLADTESGLGHLSLFKLSF